MTGTLDPRLAWQRQVIGAGDDLARSTRGIALTVGANLTYQGGLSVGVEQLVALTGYSDSTVRRALDQLRRGGWLQQVTRGYRGRVSTWRAMLPALIGPAEYSPPVGSSRPEYRSPVSAIAPEYSPRVGSSEPISAQGWAHSSYENENDRLRTRLGSPAAQHAAQGPLLAAAVDPDVAQVLQGLPAALVPASGRDETRLRGLVEQRLAAGWTPEQLIEVAGTVGDVPIRDRPAMFARHVPGRPPAGSPPRAPARPPWCGDCHEGTRLLDLDDQGVKRCPACHPLTQEARDAV